MISTLEAILLVESWLISGARKVSSEYDLVHTRRLRKFATSQDPALAQLLFGERLCDRVWGNMVFKVNFL